MNDNDTLYRKPELHVVQKGFEKPAKRTCAGCPWRKDAVPGALGGWTPEMYQEAAHGPADIACHMSKHFDGHVERHHCADAERPRSCAGLAAFRANIGWKPGVNAHPESSASKAVESSTPDAQGEVFSSPNEFILHHETPEGRREVFWRADRAGCGTRKKAG